MSAKDFPTAALDFFHQAAASLYKRGIDLAAVRAKGGSARDYFDQVLQLEGQLKIPRSLPLPPRAALPMPGVR